jgi:hypothetical protein
MLADLRAKTADPQFSLPATPTSAPINLQLTSDTNYHRFDSLLWFHSLRYLSQSILPAQETYTKSPAMATESTQGDSHDKAWEKAEKKFAKYVSCLFIFPDLKVLCFMIPPKHVIAFPKLSVIKHAVRGILFTRSTLWHLQRKTLIATLIRQRFHYRLERTRAPPAILIADFEF